MRKHPGPHALTEGDEVPPIPEPRPLSELGPEWNMEWVTGPRVRAKQYETLLTDIEYAIEWVDSMRALVDEELEDREFTIKKMELLRDWERRRKLAQKRIRSYYDPFRRKKRLLTKHVDDMLEKYHHRLQILQAEFEATAASGRGDTERALEAVNIVERLREHTKPTRPRTAAAKPAPKPKAEPRRVHHAGLPDMHPNVRTAIQNDLGGIDLDYTSNERIRELYRQNTNTPEEAINYYIDLINGTITA